VDISHERELIMTCYKREIHSAATKILQEFAGLTVCSRKRGTIKTVFIVEKGTIKKLQRIDSIVGGQCIPVGYDWNCGDVVYSVDDGGVAIRDRDWEFVDMAECVCEYLEMSITPYGAFRRRIAIVD
jgi:hypothetical protein